MKKIYKYNRYTLRLSSELNAYIKDLAVLRGIKPTAVINSILGEYRERSCHGRKKF